MLRHLLLAAGIACGATAASAVPFEVFGTDAVYGPGLAGNGSSTAPQSFSFTAGAGQTLIFSDVTGATGCCGGTVGNTGPDGGSGTTNISALNGISGIVAPRLLFLAGVFVDSSNPPADPAPGGYNYDTSANPFISDATFAGIGLNRVFFIGDGLTGTGSGTVQVFEIPEFADTLLLGFVDGWSFSGTPSYYGDNPGSVTGAFTINTPAVPLPAGLPLLAGAIGLGAWVARRRKN